jgi:DNA-binding NarL/FixJ family response regulator
VIRIVLVDDQALVRAGFRLIIDSQPDMQVVAEASDGQQALALVHKHQPDLVLMDIRMPHLDGIEATRRLAKTAHRPHILMLTTFDADEYLYDTMRAGAGGFLLKDVPPEQLISAIRIVATGDALLAPSLTRRLIERFIQRPLPARQEAPQDGLTEREREVLTHVARGESNTEIASALFISEATVKTHLTRVLTKLQLRDRVHAVVYAYEQGLITPGVSSDE